MPCAGPSAFIPEVAYRYVGSAGTDLRLGDASGTAAILLHRSSGNIGAFDLAPRSVQAAAFSESTGTGTDRLAIRTWTQDPSGVITVAPARTLYEARNIYYPDFSPDGTKIAFVEWLGGVGADAFYNLQVIDVASGVLQTVGSQLREPYYPVWSSTGEYIYYASLQPVSGLNTYLATRQPVIGGAPTVMFQKPKIGRWDITRDGTDKLIMTAGDAADTTPRSFAVWDGSSLSAAYQQLIGSSPHYACGNSKMIYTSYTKGGVRGPLKVFTPSSGSDVVYSKDQNANEADWTPCG